MKQLRDKHRSSSRGHTIESDAQNENEKERTFGKNQLNSEEQSNKKPIISVNISQYEERNNINSTPNLG
jgi:hypothetical protein